MKGRLPTLLTAALVAGACARPPERLETRLRLFEGVDVSESPSLPQVQLESPVPASLRIEDLEVGHDLRRAFVGRDGLVVRWTFRPMEGAQLEVALTAKPRSLLKNYEVRGGAPGALRPLPLQTGATDAPWIDTVVPLLGANGSTYVVEIHVAAPAGRPAVGEPVLLGPASGTKPNVVLYVIDCLRADRVGAFGSKLGLSPSIDALAREAVVVEQAWSCASWTKPSVACMFTGRYPPGHGARTVKAPIAKGIPTLAEAFAREGYATRAVVANPVLDAEAFGFGRGFRSYRNLARDYAGLAVNGVPGDTADARLITDDVGGWLKAVRNRPFFLYLHSLDLHYPYRARETPGQPKLGPTASESELYDSEFAYNDHEIGRLLDALRAEKRLEDTVVVVTADHGEEFGEHGFYRHGHTLYQNLVHVPLIIRLPGGEGAGRRVSEPMSLVDLPQTLLDLAGAPGLEGADGVSVAPWLRGEGPSRPLPLFAEEVSPVETLYAARDARYKAIDQLVPKEESLRFDLSRDPLETTPLAASDTEGEVLRRALDTFKARAQQGLHFTVAPNADQAPVRITVSSKAPLDRAYLMGQRTGDRLQVSPDLKTVTYSFLRSRYEHRLVVVPVDPSLPLEIKIEVAGAPADPAQVLVGGGLGPRGAVWSITPAQVLAGKGADKRPIQIWYQAPASDAPGEIVDPRLRDQLRALGYIK